MNPTGMGKFMDGRRMRIFVVVDDCTRASVWRLIPPSRACWDARKLDRLLGEGGCRTHAGAMELRHAPLRKASAVR
jgi:hypothetical protein